MSDEKISTTVADDLVVTIEYTMSADDEVLDSSEEDGPLEYLHGHGNITICRNEDNWEIRIEIKSLVHKLEPIHLRHLYVSHKDSGKSVLRSF